MASLTIHPSDYNVSTHSNAKPKLEDLTATENGTYTPIEGFDGFGKVNVEVQPTLEELTITENGTYYPQGSATGFSKVEANVLHKSTDIVITENGEYHPNDYEVDAFVKVGVDVKPKLEEITATDNGTYTPSEGFDGFGKVNVDLSGKVKLPSLPYIGNDCINSEGRWEGDVFIDTSLITLLNGKFTSTSKLKYIDVSGWDISNVNTLGQLFRSCNNLKTIKGLENWDTSKVTNMQQVFAVCSSLSELDIENWDVSSVTTMWYMFQNMNITSLDLSKWSVPNLVDVAEMFKYDIKLKSLIGNRTIEEVLENNIGCLNGLKVSLKLSETALDRASLRALINGLAEVETTQILTLGETLMAKLTEEDIAIATAKNWSIA